MEVWKSEEQNDDMPVCNPVKACAHFNGMKLEILHSNSLYILFIHKDIIIPHLKYFTSY